MTVNDIPEVRHHEVGVGAAPADDRVTTAGDDLRPLVWRGLALTIVTLGFYRFWYRTDLRRWYWRNTQVAGSAFEYRGTAKELFIGFLFALAIILPLYITASLIGIFASEQVGAILNLPFALIFLLLVQYGAFRSRRYRLTRTFWRGLRFDQTGSAWGYAWRSLGWAALVAVTLGLAFPFMRRALEAYKIRHTRFGTAEGGFTTPIGGLMARWLILLAPLLLSLGLALAAAFSGFVSIDELGGLIVLACLFSLFTWPAYRIAEFRTFTAGTTIGPIGFHSAIPAKTAYWIYLKFFLLLLVAITVLGLVAFALVFASVDPQQLFRTGTPPIGPLVVIILAYLLAFLIFGALKELLLNQLFWRLMAGTLTITGLESLDTVIGQSTAAEAATGEGFADALDFGGV
jgi:uncharacterized membrane protein YjgN (DUF898 family)